ncbi:hypothetical protein NCAS_0D01880 [Naumovozyma castellii]|uniref:Reverse transcriptase domain-containing protein n=1 Tax=Naumovozyma castellii TaxID=27288 RepID=G0VDX9_NAUCA|nr:hypothetical protein NCAS_0D01880 [Naumovozyma castellii CBS 4309]CCC69769.1 hypothetical protein NCAS_0D01880 [Naumovozyma castellii CBS 4309]
MFLVHLQGIWSDMFGDFDYVNVYLDEIMIFSADLEWHWKHLDGVVQTGNKSPNSKKKEVSRS